jgi:hypothetical protein
LLSKPLEIMIEGVPHNQIGGSKTHYIGAVSQTVRVGGNEPYIGMFHARKEPSTVSYTTQSDHSIVQPSI